MKTQMIQNWKKMAHILFAGLFMFGILLTASDGFAISSVASGGPWEDKDTWGGVRTPISSDIVEINGRVTVSVGGTVSGLIVNAGATLTNSYACNSDGCGGSGSVYVTGNVTNNGTISNNGTGTGSRTSTFTLGLGGTQSKSILGNPIQSSVQLCGNFEIINSPVFPEEVYICYDSTIKLSSGQSLTFFKDVIGSGRINALESTLILNGGDQILGSGLAGSVTAKEIIFGGTGTKKISNGGYDFGITAKITVQEGVTLTESVRYLSITGDVINNGTITDMNTSVSGNIANNGTWKNTDSYSVSLTGTQSRSITGNPIQSRVSLGGFEITNSPVFAGKVSFSSTTKLSGQSVTCLKDVSGTVNIPGSTLILNGGDQILGSGLDGSVTAKEIIFGGTGTKKISNGGYDFGITAKITVQEGVTLTESVRYLSITGDVINNGTITDIGLSVTGSIANNGTWKNADSYSVSLTGTQSRSITGNPIQSRVSLAGFEITNSPVFVGNVSFSSTTKLSSGQSVTCSKDVSGTVNIPGATLILNGADQILGGSVTAKEIIFGGTGTKKISNGGYDFGITGKITVQEGVTLTEGTVRYTTFYGDVINNGTITDMDLSVKGNIANNGTWKNTDSYSVGLSGTQSRSITGNPIQSRVSLAGFEITNSPVFAGNVSFDGTKLSAGQSVTCSKDVSGTVNIPGATLILNGADQKITSSVTANEVISGGTGTKTVSSMTVGKLAVPKDVTLTGSGTLTVNGDASNSGTITGTSLYLKISGNITNSGTWNNSSTYVFWTPVSGSSFYDFNITNNLSAWPAPTRPGGTSYNVGSLLTSENYWRVRASVGGTLTAWSDVKSINSSGGSGNPAPTVVTTGCKLNADNTVSASGQITDVGSSAVNIYGFVYAKHPKPYSGENMESTGDRAYPIWDQTPLSQGISFTGTIRNLLPGTYYLRAYAHNGNADSDTAQTASLGYGEDCTFTVACTSESCTPGDVNGSGGDPDLADAILVLRILAGISVTETINLNADVNGDGKIGLEELGYILQKVAELRPSGI